MNFVGWEIQPKWVANIKEAGTQAAVRMQWVDFFQSWICSCGSIIVFFQSSSFIQDSETYAFWMGLVPVFAFIRIGGGSRCARSSASFIGGCDINGVGFFDSFACSNIAFLVRSIILQRF